MFAYVLCHVMTSFIDIMNGIIDGTDKIGKVSISTPMPTMSNNTKLL